MSKNAAVDVHGGILRLLADGKFHTAEQLATGLNISRSAVMRALGEQASPRLPVFRVRGRGYRLAHGFDVLSLVAIQQLLGVSPMAAHVEILSYLDSTNAYLMQKAAAGAPQGSSVFAEFQTGGRGRRGRNWQMGWGEGLAFSLLWRFEEGAVALSGLSLAVGVALVRGLVEFGVDQIQLKWPNDLLYAGRKLGGILIEIHGDVNGPCAAVIGVGINVQHPRDIAQPVADLHETGIESLDRNRLAAFLLHALQSTLQTFTADGFVALRDDWLRYHAYNERTLRLTSGTSTIEGMFAGLGDDGALMLKTHKGIERFVVGDVSLRAEPSHGGSVE